MYDVIVIGAGPAGGCAALFCAKAGKKTLLIDNDKSITKRAMMFNHYGISEIGGPEMLENGKNMAKKFGTDVVSCTVTKLDRKTNSSNVEGGGLDIGESMVNLKVITESGDYSSRHIILATGLSTELAKTIGAKIKPGTEPHVKSVIDVDCDGRSSIPGVWGAGACAGESLHTIITAGHGAKVAVNVISEINGTRYVDHDVLKVK